MDAPVIVDPLAGVDAEANRASRLVSEFLARRIGLFNEWTGRLAARGHMDPFDPPPDLSKAFAALHMLRLCNYEAVLDDDEQDESA